MPLLINLQHLERRPLELAGQLSAAELGLSNIDELIKVSLPLQYTLKVTNPGDAILIQGSLAMTLDCECARCLKSFRKEIRWDEWSALLTLEGEDKVDVHGDSVDLTPILREDILLGLPQHPVCEPGCRGLPNGPPARDRELGDASKAAPLSSVWADLDRLKL